MERTGFLLLGLKVTTLEICTMTSFDYNYQNAFRCNLCSVDGVTHERFFIKENTEYNSLPQSILVVVVK